MRLAGHGGGCCGRRHIHGMNGQTTQTIRQLMNVEGLLDEDTNKMTEIVISEENVGYEVLKEQVVGAGFILVATWNNCSGSTCWMYMHVNDGTFFPNGAAVHVEQPDVPAPAPQRVEVPAPVRIIHSTFHNVLRDGRSEAGWPTIEAARAAAPRARSIDRKDIYSNGEVQYATNVR